MNIAVCSNVFFIAIEVDNGEVTLLQHLVLVTEVHANGVGQKTGPVVGGT